jgi:hypothetical protein
MTSTPQIVDEAEALLRQLAARLTNPRVSECLCCYVTRLLDEFPCDGTHRLAFHYRDKMAPRPTTSRSASAKLVPAVLTANCSSTDTS